MLPTDLRADLQRIRAACEQSPGLPRGLQSLPRVLERLAVNIDYLLQRELQSNHGSAQPAVWREPPRHAAGVRSHRDAVSTRSALNQHGRHAA